MSTHRKQIQVVDLFAGPGGLGEGFSAFKSSEGHSPFRIKASVEKDRSAHRTLRFRSFMRVCSEKGLELDLASFLPNHPSAEEDLLAQLGDEYRAAWEVAEAEALHAELGGDEESLARIRSALGEVGQDSILIGGPPCQAYSLVGRARNRGIAGYVPEEDARHFLYQEYVEVLESLRPSVFIMENVKGILSASVAGAPVFAKIVGDLEAAGYVLIPMAPKAPSHQQGELGFAGAPDPRDFVIHSERFGVPQARHRVIVMGIRRDLADRITEAGLSIAEFVRLEPIPTSQQATVADAIGDLPPLRSGLSRRADREIGWAQTLSEQAQRVARAAEQMEASLRVNLVELLDSAVGASSTTEPGPWESGSREILPDLADWYGRNGIILNHTARGHMADDLGRYLFASCFAAAEGRSPKATDFPADLAPKHANWSTGKFADRFRVQVAHAPSTTVTSHISKDGHYFIHPDPHQCRSLSVREAARLQTFPDDYVFLGNRTEQYVQVGNAVPPFLARKIAGAVHRVLVRTL